MQKSQLGGISEEDLKNIFGDNPINYSGLLDMDVEFIAELGSVKIPLKEILKFTRGSVRDLEKTAGESIEIFINGRIIWKGEVIVYEKNRAIRINEILESKTVLYYLSKEKKWDYIS